MALALKSLEFIKTTLPPIIVLHGLFGSKQNWTTMSKSLTKKMNRPVIPLDLRNHGDSPHSDVHNYRAMAEDVDKFVRDNGFERAGLIGHSMGGKVAMLLALQNKSWLDKTCIVDMSPINQEPGSTASFGSYVDAMKKLGEKEITDMRMADKLLAVDVPDLPTRQFLLLNLREVRDPESTSKRTYSWKINLDSIGNSLTELYKFPTEGLHEGEVLFIGGGLSDYIRPKYLPQIIKLFPKAKVITIAGAGHVVHAEKPKEFSEAILEFFK